MSFWTRIRPGTQLLSLVVVTAESRLTGVGDTLESAEPTIKKIGELANLTNTHNSVMYADGDRQNTCVIQALILGRTPPPPHPRMVLNGLVWTLLQIESLKRLEH